MEKCRNGENSKSRCKFAETIPHKWFVDMTHCPPMYRNIPGFPENRHRFRIPKIPNN
jgi:hypothetical protein